VARKIQVEIVGDSRSVERAFRRAGNAGSSFNRNMKKVAYGAGVVVGGAFLALSLALKRGFGEFMEGQKVMAQTNAVIHSTGGIANVTANHVDRLAGSLSRMSGIDDEVIAGGENMLLTFTNIRNGLGRGNRIFDKATKAVLDMSVALGRDMQPIAIMVGKALNDLEVNTKGTITGWSALRRVGVKVTAATMAQGAAFIRAGQPMKAQLLLLKELNTEFGGSAAAFGTTLPGAFAKFRNALDEVTGAFAAGLAPVVQRVATLLSNKMANPEFVARVRELGKVVGEKLFRAFTAISAWFQAHWGSIQGGFRNFVTILRNAITLATQLKSLLVTLTTPLRIQLKILIAIWDKVLAAISTGLGLISKFDIFGLGFGDKASGAQQAIDQAREVMRNPLGKSGGGPGVKGKGDIHIQGDLNAYGAQNPGQLLEQVHRQAKKKSKQTRGRHQPGLYHH
jgi:hypothetical protein